jgi:hypothetical protein
MFATVERGTNVASLRFDKVSRAGVSDLAMAATMRLLSLTPCCCFAVRELRRFRSGRSADPWAKHATDPLDDVAQLSCGATRSLSLPLRDQIKLREFRY